MMNRKLYALGIVLVLSTLIVSGCGTATVEPAVGMANPASVYCEEQGYTLEMRTDADGGTYGVCIFSDGSECDEWAFYRGECGPAPTAEPATETPSTEMEQPTPVPTPIPTEATVEETDVVNDGWLVYVNDVYGYQFSYPPSATITEQGVMGFPTDELPEGMSVDDYIAQLQETYTDKLCVSVCYELGCVNISAPPNLGGKYTHCGRTGAAYELTDKSETIVIGGQSYTATGFEEIGPGETLNYHNETLWLRLADGTVIEYGAAPNETATYEDYLQTTRDVLLQIVTSYEQIPATNPPPAMQ
jgi:putative hemolysin